MSKSRSNNADEKHPRAKEHGICGVVVVTGRFEWICVRPVHAKIYKRRSPGRRGKVIFNDNPQAEKHWFVNHYPYRKVQE